MSRMNHTRLLAASLLMGVLAGVANADNANGGNCSGNNGNHFGSQNGQADNGNHFGQDKCAEDSKEVKAEEHPVVAVAEPEILVLFGAGLAAIGAAVYLRRRQR